MISQLIEDTQIPEFDNLYLDMNSILHSCTHNNDSNDNILQRFSEEEVFAKIFTYIDHLFMVIKPKKIFYMAIDGVAPRAKMNQQRARRFRTAMDAERALQKAIANGEPIPSGEPFDSNSITPGTEFMAKLTKNLKYFIHEKITNDSRWRDVEVILSGHEVPGEGEHKIMKFIRTLRAQKDFDNNTRHCLYGLDADLIMLSMLTHAPHFALLREEVTFGKKKATDPGAPEKQNFFLLHLSLLREYLELEFTEIADELKFEYDFERILDDFILIMIVVGNDFLPNLPDLHLNKGAFPVILQTFKEALLHLDGYINEHGKVNLQRLGVWLKHLSEFELLNFEKDDIDVDWFNQQLENISLEGERKRARMGKKLLLKQQKRLVGMIQPWLIKTLNNLHPNEIENDEDTPMLDLPDREVVVENLPFLKELASDLGVFIVHSKSKDTYSLKIDVDGINPNETAEERQERIASVRKTIKRYQQSVLVEDAEELEREKSIYNTRFHDWKQQYYIDKFEFKRNDEEAIRKVAMNYIEGLQWVLFYYYRGCPSWGWYYHYYYAPRISDLHLGLDQDIQFELGKPFTPFQQLMAVLPNRSRKLIPTVLRPLMFDEHSPILDFYPNEVELDKNGKTADWEAVVKISFVDEKRLIAAMEPFLDKLTPEERQRNKFGTDLSFVFNPQVDTIYKTPLSGIFGDIEHDHCVEIEFKGRSMEGLEFRYGLLPNAKLGTELLAGFPTLKTLPFRNELLYNECLVFQSASRQQSMCLHIQDIYEENNLTLDELGQRYLGKIVYTRWPYLRESKLQSITDGNTVIEIQPVHDRLRVVKRACESFEKRQFESLKKTMLRNYSKKKAILLDDIRAIISVLPVTGLIRNQKGAYVKTYAKEPEYYPLQLMIETVTNKDERIQERPPVSIREEFPRGSSAIFLGDYAYGGETTIDGYSSESRLKITVKKRISGSEPLIGKEGAESDKKLVHYIPSYVVAGMLEISRLFLSRVTSTFLVSDVTGSNVNIGIPVKFNSQRKKVLGYSRKQPKGWEYSNLTVNLIREYRNRFPDFFARIQKLGNEIPGLEDIYPGVPLEESAKILDDVKSWLKSVTDNFVTVSLESDSLTKMSIGMVENYIIAHESVIERSETKQLARVPREAILNPRESYTLLRQQRFSLGDRVIYVQDSGKVPLFSKGTVVGYTTLGLNLSVQVLFDHEIVAGNTFGGRLRTKRGLGLDSSFLLNITDRQFIYHSNASKKHLSRHQAAANRQPYHMPSEMVKRRFLQEKRRKEAEELRRQQAHSLLNTIQHKELEGELSGSVSSDQKSAAKETEKPKYESLLKKSPITTPSSQNVPLVDNNAANTLFNAVMHQFSELNTADVNGGSPTGTVVPPQSLPYVAAPQQVNAAGFPYTPHSSQAPVNATGMLAVPQPPLPPPPGVMFPPGYPAQMMPPMNMNMPMATPPQMLGQPAPMANGGKPAHFVFRPPSEAELQEPAQEPTSPIRADQILSGNVRDGEPRPNEFQRRPRKPRHNDGNYKYKKSDGKKRPSDKRRVWTRRRESYSKGSSDTSRQTA